MIAMALLPLSLLLSSTLSAAFQFDVYPSVSISLDGLLNNQAASYNGSVADFDGLGSSYDAQLLPTGSWVYDGIEVRNITNIH